MALAIYEEPHLPHFFQPARQRLLNNLDIPEPNDKRRKMVYIDRQSTDRRIPDNEHEEMLEMFKDVEIEKDVSIEHVRLEDLSVKEQVEAVAFASVSEGPSS